MAFLSLLAILWNSAFKRQCGRPGFDPSVRKIPWRRKWQPTPVFLPGESHGQRSLVGYSPWDRKESDTTERLHFTSLLFPAICKASSDNHFAFLHFFFMGMVLITASCTMSQTSIHSSSGTLSDLIPGISLSLSLYNRKIFDLGHT